MNPLDSIWLRAPGAALKLWRSGAAAGWRLNDAARNWSRTQQLDDAAWQAAADTLLARSQPPEAGQLAVGPQTLDFECVPCDDAWLLWLSPRAAADAAGNLSVARAIDKLELISGFVQIGCFDRDAESGEAWWDAGMYRIFGFEPASRAPPFAEVVQRIHVDDRQRAAEHRAAIVRHGGRHEIHFRVVRPSGELRFVHAITQLRRGATAERARIFGVMLDETTSAAQIEAYQRESADLSRALSLAMISVWRIDLQRQRIHYNDIGYRITGIAPLPDGMPLQQMRDLAHPDDRAAVTAAAQRAMDSDDVVDVEARYLNTDGSWRHLLTRRVAERNARGEVVALAGVSLDQTRQIIERDRAQALARRIQRIADAAEVGVWSIEGPNDDVQWNAQMFRIYGLPENVSAPPVGEWMGQRVHPDDRKRVAEERRRAYKSGKAGFEAGFRIMRPDGSLRWVVCRSYRDLHDGRPVLHGIHLDVTQQRETDRTLRLHEQRLKLATRNAGLGIWELDLVSHVVVWEEQMYRLRGLIADDARTPQQIDRQCMGTEAFDQRNQRLRQHVQQGTPFEFEYAVAWPDGSLHWLASTGHLVRDDAGGPVRMVGLNWDITQRRQADAALRDKQAAERASQAKSEFLARISHELRTPLNAILGFAQLMQQDDAERLDPQQQQRLGRIRSAGAHLLSLIDDVLDLATIEAGAQALTLQPLALAELFDDVRHWFDALAAQHQVSLHLQAADARVMAEPRRLRQVLANLLSNAIKYNHPGGQVWVEAKASTRRGAAGWQISVRDDGRGLSAAQLAHLFEPFNRLGAERDGIEGRGIGLATAHHLVRLMGATLRARSRPGAGSEFHFWLRAAAVAKPAPTAPTTRPALSLLYIEDNPVNVLLMQELVAMRPNIRFASASDGLGGVATALRDNPDLVLVDMHLPDIDGNEVLRRLREQRADATLIALSANAMPDDVARAKAAGFDDYWTKPIHFNTVLSTLDRIAQRRQDDRDAATTTQQAQE